MWEWAQSYNNCTLGTGPAHKITAIAWQTTFGWVVTGEDNSYGVIAPAEISIRGLLRGAWGALELVARYTELTVDKDVYTTSARHAEQGGKPNNEDAESKSWAIGVNWYLNRMVRLMLDFD